MTIISDGRYRCIPHLIKSDDGDAVVLGSMDKLTDGFPSTQLVVQWSGLAQNEMSFLDVIFKVDPMPDRQLSVFALLNLEGIPSDTVVGIRTGQTPTSLHGLVTTITYTLPNGRVGAWWTFADGEGPTDPWVAFRIYNLTIGESVIQPGAIVKIGEVFAAPAYRWPAAELDTKIVDLSLTNEASDGTIRRVKRTPQRQLTVTIPPQPFDKAIGAFPEGTLQEFIYRTMAADFVAVVGRSAYPLDLEHDGLARQTGYLACLQDAVSIKVSAATGGISSPVTLQFKEAL